ncbi:Sensory box histidine kinase [Labilithrix luteola]|uniref:histidine kinase n=1 Tax=Labilithrix luteola TaxID=1391654 RepID=A0A0K1PJH9_9BACT|nr:Sensory box histidine kinase [Labilithrix luteola]
MILGFVAAHISTVTAAGDLRSHLTRIKTTGMRSQRLSSVRGNLHRMGMAAGRAERGEPFDRTEYDAARAAAEFDLARLRELTSADETEQLAHEDEVARTTRQAEVAIERSAALLAAGDLRGSHEASSQPIVHAADASIERLSALQMSEAEEESQRVDDTHRRLRHLSPMFDAAAAGFALLLLGLAIKAARQHARLTEEANQVAEQRAAELELFAVRVAHDLRNPLGGLALRTELGIERFASSAPFKEELQRTKRAIDRMNRIIDGLLTFARSGGHPQPDASAVVSEVLVDVASDFVTEAEVAHVELVIEPPPTMTVACSAGPLSSILGNLIRNALKFVGDGTNGNRRVVVRASSTGNRNEAVTIEVEDTGPGIPAGMEESIFDPFVRARTSDGKPGLGLGLATVKRLVEAHHGHITVRPGPSGRGACFAVVLPVA